MRQVILLALLASLFGCAGVRGPRLMLQSPSPGWEQMMPVLSGDPNDVALLMTLVHHPSRAIIRFEAWYLGTRSITDIADEIEAKLGFARVYVSNPRFDGRVASFKTTHFDRPLQIWRGKVAIFRLNEGPAARTFIVYGRWPAEYDLLLCRDFDELVRSAHLE